jgi:hypothetical protein
VTIIILKFRFEAKHKELKMYARVTTSRKNITLTLAKKFQFKFAQNLMESDKNIIFKDKHRIISRDTEIIDNKLNLSSSQYICYTESICNGILYKEGYYLTKSCNETCLFKISEIIFINQPEIMVYILAQEIRLNEFSSHYESFNVSVSEEVINCCFICDINEFDGPPINVTTISSGKKMIRLKQFN